MTDYGPPPPPHEPGPYQQDPQYPHYPHPGYPANPQPGSTLAGRLGDRLLRRPEPRFTVGLAGAGATLALLGALIWTGTYLFEGFSGNSSPLNNDRNWLGAVLFAVLAIAGFLLAAARRSNALTTAGVVLGAVGVPLALVFATFDLTTSPGFNLDAVTWVSIVIWLGVYLVLPGGRGHSFLVFLIATTLYDYALFKAIENDFTSVMRQSINGSVPTTRQPGLGTLAALGLVFGLGYFVIAFSLDRSGRHGPATGLIYPAFGATITGVVTSGKDLHVTGAGVLAIVIGTALCWYGGRFGRRVTCFLGAAGAMAGIVTILADNVDRVVAVGGSMLVVGLVVVLVAAVTGATSGEPDDMDAEAVVRAR